MNRSARPEPAIAAPALLHKWQTWALGLALMLIPFFVPIPMALRRHPIISPLGDQLHVVLLAGITLFLYWRGPLTGRLWRAALAATIIGGAIELIQTPFGRQAAWLDVVLDLVGIGLVVGWVLWRGHGQKVGLGLVLALLLVLPVRLYHVPFVAAAAYRGQAIFPIVADLEGAHDRWLWGGNQATVTIEEIPDSPTGPGHVIRLAGGPPASWPSAEMHRFPHDWSEHRYLLMDVRLVTGPKDEQRFSVRCDDFVGRREHTWIRDGFRATRSWQTFRLALYDRPVTDGPTTLDRIFERADVDRVLIYLPRPDVRIVLEIDNLRLE